MMPYHTIPSILCTVGVESPGLSYASVPQELFIRYLLLPLSAGVAPFLQAWLHLLYPVAKQMLTCNLPITST